MDKKVLETDHFILEQKNGILYGTYKAGNITLDVAKNVVRERIKYSNYQAMPMLVQDNGVKQIDRDARQYLGSARGVVGVKAGAIVTKSAFSSHLANFFLKIHVIRPAIPIRMFNCEREAEEWLKEFLN